MDVDSLDELNRRRDKRNRENVALANLGIRTSADIFEAAERQLEEARLWKAPAQAGPADTSALASLGIQTSAEIWEATQKQYEKPGQKFQPPRQQRTRKPTTASSRRAVSKVQEAVKHRGPGPGRPSRQGGRRRAGSDSTEERTPKRARNAGREEKTDAERERDVVAVLQALEDEFGEKERLSHRQEWCKPVPHERKVETVQNFYKAFHNVATLPILTCMFCYRKYGAAELGDVEWEWWRASPIEKHDQSPFQCPCCFPDGKKIPGCAECVRHLERGILSPAARLHTRLGCEHMFPNELKGLTPVEEKLIALNSCYGFITKYSLQEGHRQSVRYPKHVKGHITVFPNNVQELATNVLPHPLLKVLDEIHVSWQGAEKPAASDLSSLLSVRRRVVEKALMWLKKHNPLYADIEIDMAELNSWEAPEHGVPPQIYERLERNEPSAWDKARTGQVVPRTERGLEDNGESVDIREVLETLARGDDLEANGNVAAESREDPDGGDGAGDRNLGGTNVPIHEISSSGMFALDGQPGVTDTEKLRYAHAALDRDGGRGETGASASTGSAEVRRGHASEPYILLSRGDDFADSFEPRFLAKTFPTLFPLGSGGPRQAEENTDDVAARLGGVTGADADADADAEARARSLVSSRNMTLETWARAVLQRHGGRFATHHIFAFLIFNMGVRSRNRRVSMLSVTRSNFPDVERIVHSLSTERLEVAKVELEEAGKTADESVNQLLKSLSLYGFRQPMSRESRLSLRRKIKSAIIRDGIPAIWFTLNPNDITNPVKLRLAAYRTREPAEAEAFLTSLDLAYKRTRLAISDPLSSAMFFHREVSMFFEHYVKTGKESVFGRISRYFGAVETNERGSLHVHGLLWLQGNMHLSSILGDIEGEDQAAYRERVIQYVDSVFTEACSPESRSVAERSVTSDISSLLQNSDQFAAAFNEEANFCAGATQIHTHSPTCVKYSIGGHGGKHRNPCRFKAPWTLSDKTSFTDDGVLQIRRTHSMVNRWNRAMAVGLRHNHDISFIATQCKTMAIVFYVTNYATKVEDPVWKRVAAATEIFPVVGESTADEVESQGGQCHNKTRQFLMRVANRIFTERALSQVEVVAHLLGYPTEFASNAAWTFLNVSSLYWDILRRWRHLQHESGVETTGGQAEETVLLEATGEKVSLVQAYPHRGRLLQRLSLYDYMSVVKLKRKRKGVGAWGEIQLDESWPSSRAWVQVLRKPGEDAVVCFDGYLSTDFGAEGEDHHRRAAVQHLAIFVPWESFLYETSGDINTIWELQKQALPRRMSFVANNIQLLHRSAEDAKRDARQWAAQSGTGDAGDGAIESDSDAGDGNEESKAAYRSDDIGTATRLLDVLRQAITRKEITAGSAEISRMVQRLSRFQESVMRSTDELRGTIVSVRGLEASGAAERQPLEPMPKQERLRAIKSQQASASREKERMIQGMQSQLDDGTTSRGSAVYSVLSGYGEDDVHLTATDLEMSGVGPTARIQFGPSTSFSEAGRLLAQTFTLNREQSIALRLLCRQLDRLSHDESETPQLFQYVGGEGGTGKSRVIATVAELFAAKGISHRLLVTATSGTAAANINGITIHSACGFSKDAGPRRGRGADINDFAAQDSSSLRVDGRSTAEWREKWLLIIDEVSMLGARTLYLVNEQLRKLRGCAQDFGGIPIVLFSGDFHQFRPVQERSILLPSSSIPWDDEKSFKAEQRFQHDRAHALWNKFTTVVILHEQVRAAGDPRLQQLLKRIRHGTQDQSDVDFLNGKCYKEGRRIPWESGVTVVTPLNRNRWNLNVEATLAFQVQRQSLVRIFVSEHKWKDGQPTEEEALTMLGYGDDSEIPVPATFMFVPGMPVVVNKNTHQGLKLVNGAGYTAVDVVLDKAYPGHRISAEMALHFGPPAGIVLASETTRDFQFVGMPAGTILLTPMSTKIDCQRKRPWQKHGVSRRGLPCTAAFACTDYKVQSKTLDRVALELRGTRMTSINGEAVPSHCDPYSLYVQLSRCRTLDGITLLSRARERDFVGNCVPDDMVAAEERLEELSKATIRDAERCLGQSPSALPSQQRSNALVVGNGNNMATTDVVTTSYLLGNLHCPSCVTLIRSLLHEAYGDNVIWVSPNLVTSVVTVEHKDNTSASVRSMEKTLEDVGFEVCGINTTASSANDLYRTSAVDLGESILRPKPSSSAAEAARVAHLKNCEACRAEAANHDEPEHDEKRQLALVSSKTSELSTRRSSLPYALQQVVTDTAPPSTWRVTLSVGGMTCAVCVNTITEEIQKYPWITKASVNLVSNSATIDYTDGDRTQDIVDAIEDLGYEAAIDQVINLEEQKRSADEREVEVRVDGIFCSRCPERISTTLRSLAPDRLQIVQEPTVQNPIIRLRYTPKAPNFTIRHILRAIEAADESLKTSIYHPPTLEERSRAIRAKHQRALLYREVLTIVFAIPTFVLGIVYMSLLPDSNHGKMYLMKPWTSGLSRLDIALFILATPVYFFAADVFHVRAVKEVRTMWRSNSRMPVIQRFYRFGSMNMLVSLGTSIAYISSVAQMIAATASNRKHHASGAEMYFDSVVFLTLFLLAGRLIEGYSKSKTGDAVEMLGKLRPTTALLLEKDKAGNQTITTVAIDQLDSGDIIRIPHGTSPAADGIIVKGETSFDESSLTGESRPIKKVEGDQVFAGTINKASAVTVRVTGTSGQSMLDQIVQVVREGQTKRAPIEQIADLLTTYFVPVITLVAIITWVVWMAVGFSNAVPDHQGESSGGWVVFALQFAIAVFVVACPCGLALAAPTAIFVGGGIAAKHGILAKGGGEAFEKASKIDCVVFDKTGTLTEGGEPQITDSAVFPDNSYNEEERRDLMSALKAVEENSSHPIAKAVVSFCGTDTPTADVEGLEELPGRGMKASYKDTRAKGKDIIVGNELLMQDFSVAISAHVSSLLETWKAEAKSVALVATKPSAVKPLR
ncbi:hypothetical protein NM208_g9424 [Fusarium decemcellulare]|uniref:Uncharacterized protein n=1 Tax=Fusarium decemcellulare TaxID=57161 RepID=A0ACC1S1L8_9HYPO|nr:hypothetical protein NM208_g9424 [Fusarium decemcellulare]